jgi:hypothetical protein
MDSHKKMMLKEEEACNFAPFLIVLRGIGEL